MTLVGIAPPATSATATGVTELATWSARAGALGLDVLPGVAVLSTAALTALSVPLRGGWWWVSVCIGVGALLWTGFDRVLLPGVSGHTLGHRVFGVFVVGRDGRSVGPWTLLFRDFAHLLDTIPILAGWMWPLKDIRHRTFADMLCRTESHVRPPRSVGDQQSSRRPGALVLTTAAVLCVASATVSYIVVYQHDRSVTEVRATIAARGPGMVQQLLSYHPETIQADFDRARSLATDAYGGQLIAQQQAVLKAGPERNEYWVTNSSVLDATADHATMLLLLQGQRGAAPNQRYLTASVRVKFVEIGSTWRVDDLAVVTNVPAAMDGTR